MDKTEKILNLYIFIFFLTMVTLLVLTFAVGPLVMALIFSPYWFFGYIFTAIISPLVVVMISTIPSIYRMLMED